MKIAVIGHPCLDVINHPDGRRTESYGGIFFSVAALANLLPESDTVVPVFGIGEREHDEFIERLGRYPNVDRSGIHRFRGPTNSVSLFYGDGAERIECSKNISKPIPMTDIQPHLGVDMVLINMISGFDISLTTLDEIRMEVRDRRTPIYMDVHSLTLGVGSDFTRFHRPVEDWRRWLFMIHAAQMNEHEAAVLAAERYDEPQLARHVLALNTKALIVTRGERGCTAFVDDRKQVRRHDVDGIRTGDASPPDPTGCGDVFAAAYCSHYLRSPDVPSSVQFANRVAAAKTRMTGSDGIDRLSEYRLIDSIPDQQKP